jgi:anti-sigma-K factor RskA
MPVNDPTVEQYQLWIIDPTRDDEPIDGGVFDIASTGEVIVPVQAKLLVNQPTAFAVTIEKPGGVVVSTQERFPLLATVQKTKWIRSQNGPSESLFASDGVR